MRIEDSDSMNNRLQHFNQQELSVPVPMQIDNHRLNIARQVLCENHNERPDNEVSLLVIHNISLPAGKFGGPFIEDLFCNRLDAKADPSFASIAALNVSAHLLIRRDGSVIQFVPFNRRAWHAGVSSFEGRSQCNDFSIGIELEGADDQPFSQLQYWCLVRVTQTLMYYYPLITPQRITGHSDIAPDRKTDPGPCFDWEYYLRGLCDETD